MPSRPELTSTPEEANVAGCGTTKMGLSTCCVGVKNLGVAPAAAGCAGELGEALTGERGCPWSCICTVGSTAGAGAETGGGTGAGAWSSSPASAWGGEVMVGVRISVPPLPSEQAGEAGEPGAAGPVARSYG